MFTCSNTFGQFYRFEIIISLYMNVKARYFADTSACTDIYITSFFNNSLNEYFVKNQTLI